MVIPGSMLSPKGKLVRPGLRQRFSRQKGFGTYSQEEEPESIANHQPRASMPDMPRPDSHLLSSASERVLRTKPKRVQLKTAPTKNVEIQRDRKAREMSSLNAEKGTLQKEIEMLQREMRGLKKSCRREDSGEFTRQDLDQVLAGVLHTSLTMKSQLDQYSRIFQRMYHALLHEDDFSEDLLALRKALESSSPPKGRFSSLSPKPQVKETGLETILRRTYGTLAGWKKAVS